MKKILILFVFLGIAGISEAQNLKTIIARTENAIGLKARFGMEAIQMNGYSVMNGTTLQSPFKFIQAKPDKMRVETTIMGFKAIQTYNGTTAWSLTPTQGIEAVKVDSRDMEFISAAMAIDGPFRINKNSKYTLKDFGDTEYKGRQVHVAGWDSAEERLKYYIDKKSYLITGVRYEYKKNGGWYSMEYVVKSYFEFEGAKFPKEIAVTVNGVEMISVYVERIKRKEEMRDGLFDKPSY